MKRARLQAGHVTVEWIVATTALMVALFVPFDGDPSAVAMFVQAVKDFHASSMYALSLP